MMLILDQKIYPTNQAPLPFALTDVMAAFVGETETPILHFWQLEDSMILGMKDTRVTDLAAALAALEDFHYAPVIRNSGGLGVIADTGVLNITLVIPKGQETTDSAYEKMVRLTREAFPELTITTGEVADSYCPGTFDLSINQRKIAGIAQRKIKNGIAIMMYLSVNGSQLLRGNAVKAFYEAGLGANFGKLGYPPVRPASMTTLSEATGQDFTIEKVKQAFIKEQPVLESNHWLQQQRQQTLFTEKINAMLIRNQLLEEARG